MENQTKATLITLCRKEKKVHNLSLSLSMQRRRVKASSPAFPFIFVSSSHSLNTCLRHRMLLCLCLPSLFLEVVLVVPGMFLTVIVIHRCMAQSLHARLDHLLQVNPSLAYQHFPKRPSMCKQSIIKGGHLLCWCEWYSFKASEPGGPVTLFPFLSFFLKKRKNNFLFFPGSDLHLRVDPEM